MAAIGEFILQIVYGIRSVIMILIWTIRGSLNLGYVMNSAFGIFVDVLDFFPVGVVGILIACFAFLITLRVLGRS